MQDDQSKNVQLPRTREEAEALVRSMREAHLLTNEGLVGMARENSVDPGGSLDATEAFLATLKARFEKNRELHRGILWNEVERALRAHPDCVQKLQKLEETGGEPDVILIEKDAFRFGDCSEETPYRRRNVVFDKKAEELLSAKSSDRTWNGNAIDDAEAWGVELMSEDEYRFLQMHGTYDQKTWSWLKTPHAIRTSGDALLGGRSGTLIHLRSDLAHNHYVIGGFRCCLSVPNG